MFQSLVGLNCSCPLPPSYGYTTSCSESVSPGYMISYYCTGGYGLAGNKHRTCQENGTWTGIDPTCSEGIQINLDNDILCAELSILDSDHRKVK